MGQHSCCNKQKVKRGLWSPEEDEKLINYISTYGHGCWSTVPRRAGLQRCGKSCRLRWINYLRPDLKRGSFTPQEAGLIIDLHKLLGNKWAQIAKHLPGRTDNEVKNFWNSSIKKKLVAHGIPQIPIFPHLATNNNYNQVPTFQQTLTSAPPFIINSIPPQNPSFYFSGNADHQVFPQQAEEFNGFSDQAAVFNQSWPNFQPPAAAHGGGGYLSSQNLSSVGEFPAPESIQDFPVEQLMSSSEDFPATSEWFSVESLMSMVTVPSSCSGRTWVP